MSEQELRKRLEARGYRLEYKPDSHYPWWVCTDYMSTLCYNLQEVEVELRSAERLEDDGTNELEALYS